MTNEEQTILAEQELLEQQIPVDAGECEISIGVEHEAQEYTVPIEHEAEEQVVQVEPGNVEQAVGIEREAIKISPYVYVKQIYVGTTEEWNDRPEFIGESEHMYVYTDYDSANGSDIPGIKVGDGSSYLIDLPFVDLKHITNMQE